MSNEHVASLYKLRLEIAREQNTLREAYLNDFENAVIHLQKTKSKDLALTWLQANDASFIIFYEPETKTILGIMKAKATSTPPPGR